MMLLILFIPLVVLASSLQDIPHSIHVVNYAGDVDIYWIHPTTRQGVLYQRLASLDVVRIESYTGHDFEVRELNTDDCRIVRLQISTHDMVVQLQHDWTLLVTSDTPSQGIQRCRQVANNDPQATLHCIQPWIEYLFQQQEERLLALQEARHRTAFYLENYTCTDPSMKTSIPIYTTQWDYERHDYQVHIHHNRSTAQVHVIENFVSYDECSYLMKEASLLYTAATAEGSRHHARQANHAAIATSHLLSHLSHRMFAYANHVLYPLILTPPGQELLTAIQYHANDFYLPHCDAKSACRDASAPQSLVNGERVATMILYCNIPTKGGGTNFERMQTYVAPKLHQAVFFSYVDPIAQTMDPGWTLHAGCPVVEGEKNIVTQWWRVGVSDEWDFRHVYSTN